jgi:DNA-directed RNA polymerase subunit E'/Rpb7
MTLVSSFRNIEQYTRILVDPYYLNSDIKNNIKIILKNKVEKKCNKNGFIDEVYRILEYSDGKMPVENLNGGVIYDIKYHCKICIPIENTIIIGQIRTISPDLVIATNGPIMIFITKDNIDTNVWNISDNYLNKETNNKLLSGDYVKIQILDKRINNGDTQIRTIGRLLNYASLEEINKYYGSNVVFDERVSDNVLDETSESNFIL